MVEAALYGFAVTFLAFVVADVAVRCRNVAGIDDTSKWKGFVPIHALAIYGGILTLYCWVGWLLCVSAAVVLSDGIKIGNASGTTPLERSIMTRAMLVSEVIAVGYSFRLALQNVDMFWR